MTEATKPAIAFLGIGLMGMPMCRCLLRNDFGLTIWNRSLEKAKVLQEDGAAIATSPAVAVVDAQVIITMLSDGGAVEEVIFKQGVVKAIAGGTTHIDMSSIGADEAMGHAKRHAQGGVHYLDAPVKRVAGVDVPMPYAANLEKLALPQSSDIVSAAKAVCYRS